MPEMVTKSQLNKANERAEKARNALMRVKKESVKATKVLLRTVAAGGSAGAIGYIEGKATSTADTEMFGLPLPLVVGMGATLVNVAGYAGDEQTSDLVQAVGDGAFAAYAYGKGRQMGEDAKNAP